MVSVKILCAFLLRISAAFKVTAANFFVQGPTPCSDIYALKLGRNVLTVASR